MKLFTVKLTDDERAKLEAHRARLGLRSQSDVVRHWIAATPDRPEPTEAERRDFHAAIAKVPDLYEGPPARLTASSPIKSRLKGEWKAP